MNANPFLSSSGGSPDDGEPFKNNTFIGTCTTLQIENSNVLISRNAKRLLVGPNLEIVGKID